MWQVVQWWIICQPMQKIEKMWVPSLVQEDPLEKQMATHPSILSWEILWTEETGRLQSIGSQRAGHYGAHRHMWPLGWGMRDLVSWSGIEPGPLALEAWSLSHWTIREVPQPPPSQISLYVDWLFPGGSDGKSLCLQRRTPRFDPCVRKMPWRRKRRPTPVHLPGKSHGQRSLTGYSPWGCIVGHDWATSLSLSPFFRKIITKRSQL